MTREEKREHWLSIQRAPADTRRMRRDLSGKRRRAMVDDAHGKPCPICADPIDRGAGGALAPTIDHIRPLSRGGGNDFANLRVVHFRCNRAKGNMTERELRRAVAEAKRTLGDR